MITLTIPNTDKKTLKAASEWVVTAARPRRFSWLDFCTETAQKASSALKNNNVLSRRTWKLWAGYLKEDFLSRRLGALPPGSAPAAALSDAYTRNNAISPQMRAILARAAASFAYRPRFSILMPVYNADPRFLEEAIRSVTEQIYPEWELCIADDRSTRPDTIDVLKSFEGEPRIKITYREENGHICKATNSAAETATGDYVIFMDNDDLLAPHACFEIARLLQAHPEADVIYSDEDKIDPEGRHFDLHFKPDWSPVLLLGYNYINHLTCIRRTLFERAGLLRPGFDGAQDYDLLLRATEMTDRVRHIPKVLYHWRAIPGSTAFKAEEKPIVTTAAEKALQEAIQRRRLPATAYRPEFAREFRLPLYQLDWDDTGPAVEIVIRGAGDHEAVRRSVDAILSGTDYKNYGIIILDNGDAPSDSTPVEGGVRVERLVAGEGCIPAAEASRAEFLLFLDAGAEPVEPRWLSRLVGYAALDDVGAVGARVVTGEGRVAHGGVVLGNGPEWAFRLHSARFPSYFFLAETARECAAVSGGCLLTRRRSFLENGGFGAEWSAPLLRDADYCMRLAESGLKTLYLPGGELVRHAESESGCDHSQLDLFRERHGHVRDGYYNPNLDSETPYLVSPECRLDYADLIGRPLKVVFFTHNLNLEGAPGILMQVARGLKGRGRVVPVVVSSLDGPARRELEAAGIECRILRMRNSDDFLMPWAGKEELEGAVDKMVAFFDAAKPDVVVANVINSFLAVEAAWRLAIPSVWWIHESYNRPLMLKNLNSAALPMCEAAFATATQVLFVSEETAALYACYNASRNFSVIRNSLDKSFIEGAGKSVSRGEAKRKLSLDGSRKVILSVGTVCERKDQGTIVEALALLAGKRDDFICYLVGYKDFLPYGRFVKGRIEGLGVGAFVKLVAETRDVADYYAAADIFVFSSLNESYSLTILEAMAFGLPIVTTSCCGVSEQVRFGVNALPYDFQDAAQLAEQLDHLLDDPERRKELGENGRRLLGSMQSCDEMLERHEHLILSVFQRGGGA